MKTKCFCICCSKHPFEKQDINSNMSLDEVKLNPDNLFQGFFNKRLIEFGIHYKRILEMATEVFVELDSEIICIKNRYGQTDLDNESEIKE